MPCFFQMLINAIVIVTAVSLTTFGNIGKPKMWRKQLQMVRLAKVTCKRSGNRLPSFDPHSPSFEHSRCFSNDKVADGAADLLEVLRNSPLEKMNFGGCSQIPSSAWQKLRGASWTNLREANFERCLVLQTWLRCLASSLDAVFFLNPSASKSELNHTLYQRRSLTMVTKIVG